MQGHKAVHDITNIHDDVYRIERTEGRSDLTVLIADIYICGEADIYDIAYNYHDLDCIVLVGFYNRYSLNAKDAARTNHIGLYDMREFYGAIHLVGDRMLDYVKKEKK
jgi:hypothetical protein